MARYQTNNLRGIALMLLAMLLFIVMDAFAKWLVSADMSAAQIVAVRSWMICAAIPLILLARGELGQLRTEKPFSHLARGMPGFFAPFLFFTALGRLPIADATVVFFSAAFMLTIASVLVLGEKVGIHRWSAVIIGFVGVVIAVNPVGGGDVVAYLMVLGSTTVYAIIFITGKVLSARDSIISLVFSLHFGMGVSATATLPWVWTPLTPENFAGIVVIAVIALVAHTVFTAAFALGEVSVLAPFEYTALVWATLIGYVVWSDFPATEVWIGAAIIIACGLYVIHRETLHHAQKADLRE